MGLREDLIEAWQISNRINLYFLEAIPDQDLIVKPDKGRSVRGQFCHMVQVRLMWLKAASPEMRDGLVIPDADKATKAEIACALQSSGVAIANLISESSADGKRLKGFKPTTLAFAMYLVSHEAHHRGMVELALRQAGRPLSDKVSYGMWEWGSR